MESAPEKCPLCSSTRREFLIKKDNWTVFRCPECGLGVLDPRPSEDEIDQLYREQYFSDQYHDGIGIESPQFRKVLRNESHRTRFIKSKKRSGRLLDIGCGYGYFAAACREMGYDVQGIDVSEWAAQHAVNRLDIPVSIGKINEIELTPHSFDIITMWHFLEHAPDPHLVLQKVKTWLKKDGILVIDVPNYQGTDAQREWQDWVGWQLPYHFWHFNIGSLCRLLDQHGYHIIKKKDYHSEVIKNRLKRIPFIGLFGRIIAKMYSGTSVAVIAKQTK